MNTPRRFHLLRKETGCEPVVAARGVEFPGGPVVVVWHPSQELGVHPSIDDIEFPEPGPTGIFLHWLDKAPGDPITFTEPSTRQGFHLDGNRITYAITDEVAGLVIGPRRAREDSEEPPVSAPGRRFAFDGVVIEGKEILVREDVVDLARRMGVEE